MLRSFPTGELAGLIIGSGGFRIGVRCARCRSAVCRRGCGEKVDWRRKPLPGDSVALFPERECIVQAASLGELGLVLG
jgi:hypothetical protein